MNMKTHRTHHNIQDKNIRKKLRNSATIQEIKLWGFIKNSQLGVKFRRQHGIGPYIVDFCCPAKKIIIEIDGSQHIENKEYDDARTLFLEKLGYQVLRFWNNEINDTIEGVIMKIQQSIYEQK